MRTPKDLYAAVEFFPRPKEMFDLHKGMDRFREGKGEIAVSWRVFSEEGCTRIIRAAFEYAKATGRKTVHCLQQGQRHPPDRRHDEAHLP